MHNPIFASNIFRCMFKSRFYNILLLLCCSVILSLLWSITPAQSQTTKSSELQNDFQKPNTLYTIESKLNLQGGTLTLPEGCTLRFQGGCIENGTVIFNKTTLDRPQFKNVRFQGSVYNEDFTITDYGAVAGKDMDCSVIINDLIKLESVAIPSRSAKTIRIPNGTFYIDHPIELWAGWEAPITLVGNGNTSTICQRHDNDYILKVYECHYVRNLRLVFKNRQSIKKSRSVAIACERAIYCLFENLTISKAYNAVGYIQAADLKKSSPTGVKQQCYVSCNFRNIRIYETSNYAFDFKKELDNGDSGSVYDNIYINSNDMGGETKDNVMAGAIRGANTVGCFTQLNIEGTNYASALIDISGMSRLSISSLHIEGIIDMPVIVKTAIQSVASIDCLDVQHCTFSGTQYRAFKVSDSGWVTVNHLLLRSDNKNNVGSYKSQVYNRLSNTSCGVIIQHKLDPIKLFENNK